MSLRMFHAQQSGGSLASGRGKRKQKKYITLARYTATRKRTSHLQKSLPLSTPKGRPGVLDVVIFFNHSLFGQPVGPESTYRWPSLLTLYPTRHTAREGIHAPTLPIAPTHSAHFPPSCRPRTPQRPHVTTGTVFQTRGSRYIYL